MSTATLSWRSARRQIFGGETSHNRGRGPQPHKAEHTRHYKKEGGTVFVLLGGGTSQANQTPNTGVPTDQSELVAALRDQIRDLREQLGQANERDRENRRIIAAFTGRIPAIEAPPQEPSEPPSEATEQPGRVEPQPAVGDAQ
jgi:hypothetical protein